MKHCLSTWLGVPCVGLFLSACGTGPAGDGDLAQIREAAVLINATFDTSSSGFTYVDDTFGTNVPDGASGTVTNQRLRVTLGRQVAATQPPTQAPPQSGGWRATFNATGPVTGSFFYQLSTSGSFETAECTEVRMTIDSTTYGTGTNPYVARFCGASGSLSGTFNFTTPSLPSGSHTITIGGYLSSNSEPSETSTIDIDNVVVNGTPPGGCGDLTCAAGETCSTCPQDCGACPTCPNGSCSGGETCSTCPQDCGACPTCPNGSCSGGETCSTCPQDCGACPPAGDVAFIESNSQVVMEAESSTGNTPQGGNSWVPDTASSPSNGQARRADPNMGTARTMGYTTTSPRLDFRISFTQTGAYNVWLRGRATGTVANDDSVHAGLDGVDVTTARYMNGFTGSYTWRRSRDGGLNATVNVASPGIHTFNLWMREDGFAIDKIVLNKSSTTPSGTGPAQSARLNVCSDGLCNGAETCTSCAADCGACPTCPNGTCSGGETCSTCPQDCGACPPACPDGACNGTETCTSCPSDCGACPPACPDGACNGTETCTSCPSDCGACPPACPDGTCNGTETCSSCPSDCGACPPACPDGTCNGTETCSSCPSDCGACPPTCPNGTCGAGETCTSCPQDCGACPAWGLDSRPANPTCVAPPSLATGFVLNRRWPNLTFTQPLGLVQAPGDPTRFYVLEKTGRLRVVASDNAATTAPNFLDLSTVVNAESEGGLLSAAFHPGFATNRFVFVSYTLNVGGTFTMRVSRFTANADGTGVVAGSEVQLLNHSKTKTNHNAGNIAFGPDGYLYVSFGDDAWQDPPRMLQAADPNNWFGKVLRINVNSSPYTIPSDNPFATGGGRPEVYAYGLRNPWRFSFDRVTGALYLADVGEDRWEEIDTIVNGGFYGWPHREADYCRPGMNCALAYRSPEFAYEHGGPLSITGGYVYRGAAIPELVGHYVYGDYITGAVWEYDTQAHLNRTIQAANGVTLSAFGEDNSGELYAIRHSSGIIERLERTTGGGPTDFPALITETGCFQTSNPTAVVSGVIPYSIALPFWSDGAEKERYVALPDSTTMNIDSSGDWVLPPGGVSIKNFRWQGQLFETRFFVRHTNGTYSGYTYQWNAGQTQATLVPTGGATRTLPSEPSDLAWGYPSRNACFACHSDAAGGSLGLETRQVNVNGFYPTTGRTANQFVTLDHIGMLSGNIASMQPFPIETDLGAPILDRAKAYLHVNCSNCHRPGGPGRGNFDARFQTLFGDMRLCNEPPTLGNLGVPGAMLLKPGDSESSVAWLRMSQRTANFMPPLASTVTDAAGAALLSEWIEGVSTCPPPTVLACNVAQNRVANCDFAGGTSSWQLRLNAGSGSHVMTGAELRIDISNPGTLDWHVQDVQVLGALSAGTYQISFDARAASPRTIVVNMGEEGDDYSSFCQQQLTLTTTMATYTVPCNMPAADNNVKLDFNVGLTSTASVFLDNVYFGPPR